MEFLKRIYRWPTFGSAFFEVKVGFNPCQPLPNTGPVYVSAQCLSVERSVCSNCNPVEHLKSGHLGAEEMSQLAKHLRI